MSRQIEHPIKSAFCLRIMAENELGEIKELAQFLGLPESTVRKLARRESIMPRAETVDKLSKRLGISTMDVIQGLLGLQEAR